MKYKITKEQIESLRCVMNISSCENGISFLKEWFPDAFKTVLEVGRWYWHSGELFNYQEGNNVYGFNGDGTWCTVSSWSWPNKLLYDREATESEVFEALKKEAVKRYGNGELVECLKSKEYGWKNKLKTIQHDTLYYYPQTGDFWASGDNGLAVCVFMNGKWAEILETITKEEAEKKFNCKII